MPAARSHIAFTVDRRLTLGALTGVLVAIFWFGWNASTASGRIDRLEIDVKPMQQINERTIRIEEQVAAIRRELESWRTVK